MAEKNQKTPQKAPEEKQEKEKKGRPQEERQETLVRVMGYDVFGSKSVYTGLTKIKGVSWAIANAVCKNMKLDRKKKFADLTKDEVKAIEDGLRNLEVYGFLKNRRGDIDSGEDRHLFATDLDMRKEFDIKRLKKIKSYRGNRHSLGLPVRGQRTRSHFRKGGAVGVKKPKGGKKS